MIYLASPYSHSDASVREERFQAACRAAAALIRAGHVVFSPVAHTHPIAAHGLPYDWNFWERIDSAQLARCDDLVVLTLEGWQQSEGVQAELRLAAELGKPVGYLAPEAPCRVTLGHVAKGADV